VSRVAGRGEFAEDLRNTGLLRSRRNHKHPILDRALAGRRTERERESERERENGQLRTEQHTRKRAYTHPQRSSPRGGGKRGCCVRGRGRAKTTPPGSRRRLRRRTIVEFFSGLMPRPLIDTFVVTSCLPIRPSIFPPLFVTAGEFAGRTCRETRTDDAWTSKRSLYRAIVLRLSLFNFAHIYQSAASTNGQQRGPEADRGATSVSRSGTVIPRKGTSLPRAFPFSATRFLFHLRLVSLPKSFGRIRVYRVGCARERRALIND